jgi:hypothetical protein
MYALADLNRQVASDEKISYAGERLAATQSPTPLRSLSTNKPARLIGGGPNDAQPYAAFLSTISREGASSCLRQAGQKQTKL